MKLVLALVLVTSTAAAADGFVQGIAGYSSPIAGEQYMDGVDGGGARIGVRGGWSPLQNGRVRFGFDGGIDWRPLDIADGSAQQFRVLVGPRVSFVADRYAVFFRTAVGYDHLELGNDVNDTGYAFEPGFGATYRYKTLLFGGEVAVPVIRHRAQTGGDYMDGFAGADLQLMISVGAEL